MIKMKAILRFISYIVSYIIPVDKRLILFVSNPDYADNGYAVFRYMLEHKDKFNYKFYWLFADVERNKPILEDELISVFGGMHVNCCTRKSFKGVWLAYRARYIFNTCGLFAIIKFHQKDKRINMWHGMPFKRISSIYPNGDFSIATSKTFVPIMAEGLNMPPERILLVGQPRNDFMFRQDLLKTNFLVKKYNKIGIWMPTFRKTTDGVYNDGIFDEDSISFVKMSKLEELNEVLCKNNTLLIIKLHPLDVLQNKNFLNHSNIIILNNKNFHNKDLYPLLGICDFMLTDFSSVAIDFEILNRPIGFTLDNIDNYKKTRGFVLQEFPGKYLYDFDEMKSFIISILEGTLKTEDFGEKYNKYKDGNSTERLLKELKFIK